MMRRATFFCGAVLAGLLLLAAPARAQTDTAPSSSSSVNDDDYTGCQNLTVDPPSALAGDEVTVSGVAITPGSTIDIFVDGVLNTQTTAGADGSFSATFIASGNPGDTVTIQAKQVGDATDPFVGCPDQVGSLEILAPPATPTAAPLARTGSNSTLPLVRLGFALVAAGGLVVLVTRRRKSAGIAA